MFVFLRQSLALEERLSIVIIICVTTPPHGDGVLPQYYSLASCRGGEAAIAPPLGEGCLTMSLLSSTHHRHAYTIVIFIVTPHRCHVIGSPLVGEEYPCREVYLHT